MTERLPQNRIKYFDLMKGVCITLVIIGHCCGELPENIDGGHLWSMLEHLRMPLYFFLSGMFFKEYNGIIDFMVRKFNKLLIPYIFFCVVSVVPKLYIGDVDCTIESIRQHIFWMLKNGGYLWFLSTLFFANIIYYVYSQLVKSYNILIQIIVLLLITAVGWYYGITAMIVLPFFYVALKARKYLSLINNVKLQTLLCVFLLAGFICFTTSSGGVYLSKGYVQNNIVLFYIASISAIVYCWCVCYAIKEMIYFSYIGRYSIIAYVTHYPIIWIILNEYPEINKYLLSIVVLSVMPLIIWFLKRYFPVFVAQRDLFLYENGRLRVDWNAFSFKKR